MDLISRQQAVDAINEYMKRLRIHIATPNDTESYSYARGLLVGVINDIKQLPPIQPADPQERKTGYWQITDAYPHNVYCSKCHKRFAQTHWTVWEDGSLPRKFCPNCGARMEGADE